MYMIVIYRETIVPQPLDQNLNNSNTTYDVLQRFLDFRLIYLHYSSLQNKLEFKLASLSAFEEKIQHREKESGGLADQARQKVLAHVRSHVHACALLCYYLYRFF